MHFIQRIRRVGVRTLVLLVAFLLMAGCRKDNESASIDGHSNLLAIRPDSGLDFRLLVPRDTIPLGSPIQVMYFLVNGSTRSSIWNNPDLFRFDVESWEGNAIPFEAAGSQTVNWGPLARMVLPANGVLGQLVDLQCMHHQFVTSQDDNRCEAKYRFNRAGKYRVIGTYKRPKQGLYAGPDLVDTAVFVLK
jgi:hypothetical protein